MTVPVADAEVDFPQGKLPRAAELVCKLYRKKGKAQDFIIT